MSQAPIKVYGTKWCPDCLRVKQVLGRHKIAFDWYDIQEEKQLSAFVEKVNGGYKSVPTIVFPDGSIMVEPGNTELEKKLTEAGYL